ncbi:MAG: XdhC family protein [Synoicihabitans sp.]
MSEIFTIANFLQNETRFPVVLATLVSVQGSSYRREGARRVICPDGRAMGSISGGCLEEDLSGHALNLLESGRSYETITYDTTSENDLVWGVGTGCHGIVKIFLEKLDSAPDWAGEIIRAAQKRHSLALATPREPNETDEAIPKTSLCDLNTEPAGTHVQTISPPRRVIIFGAGDDAIPLCAQITTLGWDAVVCDPRAQLVTRERFLSATQVMELPVEESATRFEWDDHTVAVVMTHHYRFDLPILRALVPLHLPFLGLLGPKARGQRLLRDAGFDPAVTDLHNPIGLDLGGDGPAAIALAIVAEIQARLNHRSARPLRERNSPIHATETE